MQAHSGPLNTRLAAWVFLPAAYNQHTHGYTSQFPAASVPELTYGESYAVLEWHLGTLSIQPQHNPGTSFSVCDSQVPNAVVLHVMVQMQGSETSPPLSDACLAERMEGTKIFLQNAGNPWVSSYFTGVEREIIQCQELPSCSSFP